MMPRKIRKFYDEIFDMLVDAGIEEETAQEHIDKQEEATEDLLDEESEGDDVVDDDEEKPKKK